VKIPLLFLLLPALLACSVGDKKSWDSEPFDNGGQHPVTVVSHGWHTSLVVPAPLLMASLPRLAERFGDAGYIEIGWGDQGFYQASEISFGLALNALLWPTSSVIHAVAVPGDVRAFFVNSDSQRLCLTDQQLVSVIEFIVSSFALDDDGTVQPLQRGVYGDSQFYLASGSYHMLNTCNSWTARGLQTMGMDIFPATKLTAGSVMDYLSRALPDNHAATLPACAES